MKPLSPGLELGARFVLVRRIAEGATAEVWLAEDREGGRRVALKLLDATALSAPGAMARLRESLALAGRLDAGQAVEVLGLHELDGLVGIAMEYLSGGDLGQFRGRPFAVFARPLADLAGILATAHERGLVHRDLKCANVLLDAGGRVRLADFGLAARAGASAAVSSPYNMSPQQLRGDPAAPADDLYAFGAMLYELQAGHPPFYPDITRERVLHEPVPPLVPRFPAPERARQLTLRLLSKSVAARPAGMHEVRGELEAALLEPEEGDVATPALAVPGPPAASTGPAPARRVSRLMSGIVALAVVIGLAVVFLWLPQRVAERSAAGERDAAAAALAEAARSRQAQEQAVSREQARAEAGSARDAFAARLAAVEGQAAAVWATAALAGARERAVAAMREFDLGDYAAAREHWDAATAALAAIEAERPAALAAALAAGEEAIRRGNAEAATQSFTLAQVIEPGNAAALRGLGRAGQLDEVFALLDAAARDEQAGRTDEAVRKYRQALELDADAPGAEAAIARIAAGRADDAFAAVMSRGMAAMAAGRLEEAAAAFGEARAMRPGAAAVQAGLDELARVRQASGLQALTTRALAAERAEDWVAARQAWSDALVVEPTLVPAQAGLERSMPRVQLDARLGALLDQPQGLWSPEGKAEAESVLAAAAAAEAPNAILSRRATRLAGLLQAARTPVPLVLQSDGQTEVVIYRVGRIGAFHRHEVAVIPGRYAVVGTRPGFRDVRREVEILPGSVPAPVMVKCEETL